MEEFIVNFNGEKSVTCVIAGNLQEAAYLFARLQIHAGEQETQRDFDRKPPIEVRTDSGKRRLFRIKVAEIDANITRIAYEEMGVANV
ncbi:hypothetical protein [Maridesulfovibrio bastinii]|uniref:hypothetical protein n=1 Tax=Maridesulfovibrio bastinii TaxID=47157 RepID=UPI0004012E37|nr:hypothetical protein [Maridesulfovibrio bastinii]